MMDSVSSEVPRATYYLELAIRQACLNLNPNRRILVGLLVAPLKKLLALSVIFHQLLMPRYRLIQNSLKVPIATPPKPHTQINVSSLMFLPQLTTLLRR